jgi:hypothetical protein
LSECGDDGGGGGGISSFLSRRPCGVFFCVIYFVAPVHEVRLRPLIDFSAAHRVFKIYAAKFLAIKNEKKKPANYATCPYFEVSKQL